MINEKANLERKPWSSFSPKQNLKFSLSLHPSRPAIVKSTKYLPSSFYLSSNAFLFSSTKFSLFQPLTHHLTQISHHSHHHSSFSPDFPDFPSDETWITECFQIWVPLDSCVANIIYFEPVYLMHVMSSHSFRWAKISVKFLSYVC